MPRGGRWLIAATLAAGCPPTTWAPSAATAEGPGSSGEGSSGEKNPTTGEGSSTGSTTNAESSTGPAATTGTAGTTTGEPLAPPEIVQVTFMPNPVKVVGAVRVEVETAHADAVSMAGVTESPIELVEERPHTFVDAMSIAVVSAEANTLPHCATFTPWRDGIAGAAEEHCFAVELDPGGTELFWDGATDDGTGSIAALAMLPDGHVVEFGTYYPNGQPRCYLRRRDPGGAWAAADFVTSFLAATCTATDLMVTSVGEIYLLANVTQNGTNGWWLGRMNGWNGATQKVGSGIVGSTGRALARDPNSDRVAVCGTYPTQNPNDVMDAALWFFQNGKSGPNVQFDYVPKLDKLHMFRETPNDCAFAGDNVLLAGEARGRHGDELEVHDRLFLLEYGPSVPTGKFTIAGLETGLDSGATALTIDEDGDYVTAGYACGEPCEKAPELRVFSADGAQISQAALPSNMLAPLDLAASPAGYVVLATGTLPDPSLFTVRAWEPATNSWIWTYEHKGAPTSEIALALAIGPYGQVYAGGISAGGYPAIAFVAP